jgi:hypothetical protein
MGRTDQALAEGADALRRANESAALQAVPAIEPALTVAAHRRRARARTRRGIHSSHYRPTRKPRAIIAGIASNGGGTIPRGARADVAQLVDALAL